MNRALAAVMDALAAYVAAPEGDENRRRLQCSRRDAAALVASLRASQAEAPVVKAAIELGKKIAASGVTDLPVATEDLERARQFFALGWPGLLAAMLLVPAWQWSGAPRLEDTPRWLWPDYVGHLFHAPQGFSALGQADAYGAYYLARLEELARLAAANRGSNAVRAAVTAFVGASNCIPLYFSADSLRRHYELRGRLFALVGAIDAAPEMLPRAREGRRLRVGFVNRHFGPQTETYTTLPMFEQLDAGRFEVLLFVHRRTNTPVEQFAGERVAEFRVLPEDFAEQVASLRAAELDVVVFGTNVTAVFNEVTRLALHRVAPLQVVNNSSCTTSGLPEIDLYLSGTLTETPEAPEHFTERLALLTGPTHAFNYETDRQEPTTRWTRAALGLPDDATVFVSAANYFKIIPEMQHAWARLLAAVPGSRLLLHPFNPNWSSNYPIRRFQAEISRVLETHGVESSRLVLSSNRFSSRSDVKELLGIGDVYLDTFPFGGVNSLVDPLELGLPVVAWEGRTMRSRMGAALLRQLQISELIATDEAGYLAIATRLARDGAHRTAMRERIRGAMAAAPLFLDSLAASDLTGALLETAYDELVAVGREAFRAARKPICTPADTPIGAVSRQRRANSLLAAGHVARAADYLVAAVANDPNDAAIWFDLAIALRRQDRMPQAVQALEASLRADPRRVAAWVMLGELALAAGNRDLFQEVQGVLRELTPGIPPIVACDRGAADAPDLERKQRVLLYTDDPEHGGVAQYNHSLLAGLVAAGYDVVCAQTRCDSPLVRQQRELGVQHQWISYDTKKEFARTLGDPAEPRRIFETVRPDLVIFSDCCPLSNFAARDAALQLGLPYVVVVGFVGAYLADRFASSLGRLATHYAQARAVVAVSRENLDLLRQRFGLAATAGQVIHYGRPEKYFAPRDPAVRTRLRAELSLPDDTVVCFTAARLDPIKGFHFQIEAARQIARLGAKNLHFVWAGAGEQRAELEQQIATAGLGGRVHLLGHRWDAADWYDAADIFVLPSDLEGMPLAIMEAMAKGLPVIATAVSGIPEELGDTGRLLPKPSAHPAGVVASLVETLRTWAADPTLRAREGARCRTRAAEFFRESRMTDETLALVAAHVGERVEAASTSA